MVLRSEVDLEMCLTSMTKNAINRSYPVLIAPVSFITNKPEQFLNTSAALDPFSYGLWISLITFLFLVAFLYYVLTTKQVEFQNVLFNVFGNVLQQQPLRFALKKNSVRWLLFAWLLGIMVLGSSYKAALLSFLLAPTEFVIRDVPQLAREANKHSVTCTTADHNYNVCKTRLLDSDIESYKAVGACLARNKRRTAGKMFLDIPPKKARILHILFKENYKYDYSVADDYFYIDLFGYRYSKRFLLADRLNEILLRLQAAGLHEKYYGDEAFFQNLPANLKRAPPLTTLNPISLDNLYGAFILLMFGWGIGLITLFAEIVSYKRNFCVSTNA